MGHCPLKMIQLIGRAKRTPTLGCSIEISRDIYKYVGRSVGRSVCLSCPKMRRRNYVAQMRACSKSDLGGYNRPMTPVYSFRLYARVALALMKKKK